MQEYKVIGVMSGTSLDGIDIAYCIFKFHNNQWKFSIEKAHTIAYTNDWIKKLKLLLNESNDIISSVDIEYGKLLGEAVNSFIQKNGLKPDFICSHGHTVLHQPEKGLTLQIGNGSEMVKVCNTPVINDFRSLDVSLGGQGAPLVPIGDKLLFPEYSYCLNLGGFANISYDNNNGIRRAFDISPANLPINYLVEQLGLKMDNNGLIAKSGKIDQKLLRRLNSIPYYSLSPPKSLGKEWLDREFMPVIKSNNASIKDKLRTITEHISIQISQSIKPNKKGKLLITGGGVFNSFLIERIKNKMLMEVIIPNTKIIEFKEALIFGLLGILRYRNETNCIASVTGASKDSSGGIIHFP